MSEIGKEGDPSGDMDLCYQYGSCLVPIASTFSILKDHLPKDHMNSSNSG